MNWGKWIVVAFVAFAGFIATLVTICMKQDVHLVSRDYYQEELDYQQQIRRINNIGHLKQKPEIRKSGYMIIIDFDRFNEIEGGTLTLFNPADAKKDQVHLLAASNETQQRISVDPDTRGMYRARMQWVMNGNEYYLETILNF